MAGKEVERGASMYRIKSKKEVLKEYQNRYPGLDKVFLKELGKEYDRYIGLLKNTKTRKDAMEVFEEEIKRNEKNFKRNANMTCLEGSVHNQYMEILANYGLIVFFRDNMID